MPFATCRSEVTKGPLWGGSKTPDDSDSSSPEASGPCWDNPTFNTAHFILRLTRPGETSLSAEGSLALSPGSWEPADRGTATAKHSTATRPVLHQARLAVDWRPSTSPPSVNPADVSVTRVTRWSRQDQSSGGSRTPALLGSGFNTCNRCPCDSTRRKAIERERTLGPAHLARTAPWGAFDPPRCRTRPCGCQNRSGQRNAFRRVERSKDAALLHARARDGGLRQCADATNPLCTKACRILVLVAIRRRYQQNSKHSDG